MVLSTTYQKECHKAHESVKKAKISFETILQRFQQSDKITAGDWINLRSKIILTRRRMKKDEDARKFGH